MENKELNLCELLKEHEGEEFYSPAYGNVTLEVISNEKITTLYAEDLVAYIIFNKNGKLFSTGEPMLYPILEDSPNCSFESAWSKWAEKNRKTTYTDVVDELFSKKAWIQDDDDLTQFILEPSVNTKNPFIATSKKQLQKLEAINKLMNVQKYLEKGWQPDYSNSEEAKYYIFQENGNIGIGINNKMNVAPVVFSSKTTARKAIEILGEKTIKLALSTDW